MWMPIVVLALGVVLVTGFRRLVPPGRVERLLKLVFGIRILLHEGRALVEIVITNAPRAGRLYDG